MEMSPTNLYIGKAFKVKDLQVYFKKLKLKATFQAAQIFIFKK